VLNITLCIANKSSSILSYCQSGLIDLNHLIYLNHLINLFSILVGFYMAYAVLMQKAKSTSYDDTS